MTTILTILGSIATLAGVALTVAGCTYLPRLTARAMDLLDP